VVTQGLSRGRCEYRFMVIDEGDVILRENFGDARSEKIL
jgi:hypothetical protein